MNKELMFDQIAKALKDANELIGIIALDGTILFDNFAWPLSEETYVGIKKLIDLEDEEHRETRKNNIQEVVDSHETKVFSEIGNLGKRIRTIRFPLYDNENNLYATGVIAREI